MGKARLAVLGVLFASASASADTTPQTLPFSQDWSNTGLITTNDDWSGVPGITGYLGQDASTTTGGVFDPQLVLTESTVANDLTVLANQTAPNSVTAGDVGEFEIADPVVALQASGTADTPYVMVTLNTTGSSFIRVRYNVRDIDGSVDNTMQKVALQYRVGTTGNFTNVPTAYVADATEQSLATKVTAVDVILPAAVDNQPVVQIRMITANEVGSDEWVGIDDIRVDSATTNPSATGAATPDHTAVGGTTTLSATVTPGTFPTSTGLNVTCDVTSVGGSSSQSLYDDGSNGDATAGDNMFTFASLAIPTGAAPGLKTFPCLVTDAESRTGTFNITFTVDAVCGDSLIQGVETCDDGGQTAGDGCSATCQIETGWTCTGEPSTCMDIDECTAATDDCATNATCTNTVGSFSCACNAGYTGDGHTGGTGCTDIDECTMNTDDCDANATCTNTPGAWTCACKTGFTGNGQTCTDTDECTAGTDNCDANATCTNTSGSFTCQCMAGYSGSGTTCMPSCGDGILKMPEACDDGNMASGDGCSMNCSIETGYTCTGTPSSCAATCGDGMMLGGETCDDGNATANDGCSSSCQIEAGYTCTGSPSDCAAKDDGGCCSSSTHPGSVGLLVLFVVGGLRRRKRAC